VVQDGTKFQRRRVRRLRDGGTMPATRGHTLYLVGGAPRVGKSSLAQRLLNTDGIPWLPTDVLRTVLRRVLPGLDAVDQDPVDARLLAEVTYPHVEQAAEVCAEEAERFLIEGFELSPSYPRACGRRWRGPRSGPASWGRLVLPRRPRRLPGPQAPAPRRVARGAPPGRGLDPAAEPATAPRVRRRRRAERRRGRGRLRAAGLPTSTSATSSPTAPATPWSTAGEVAPRAGEQEAG
jgi:hypothetical protein